MERVEDWRVEVAHYRNSEVEDIVPESFIREEKPNVEHVVLKSCEDVAKRALGSDVEFIGSWTLSHENEVGVLNGHFVHFQSLLVFRNFQLLPVFRVERAPLGLGNERRSVYRVEDDEDARGKSLDYAQVVYGFYHPLRDVHVSVEVLSPIEEQHECIYTKGHNSGEVLEEVKSARSDFNELARKAFVHFHLINQIGCFLYQTSNLQVGIVSLDRQEQIGPGGLREEVADGPYREVHSLKRALGLHFYSACVSLEEIERLPLVYREILPLYLLPRFLVRISKSGKKNVNLEGLIDIVFKSILGERI